MHTFNYQIILSINPNTITHSIDDWFSTLANIYGQPSKHFDGYVSMVIKDNTTLTIICYVIEGHEEKSKLDSLKSRNKDWPGFRSLCIMDAIKIRARSLGYTINETSIELLQGGSKDRSATPT
jgi:hypothetical protein